MSRLLVSSSPRSNLPKAPTGIAGFDEITGGGLPRGRATLVCGSAGCGKTLFGAEFLTRGATQFDEPGVFVSFEETGDDLAENVRSLGFDLARLEAEKQLVIDAIQLERSEIHETGDYDLDGLLIRLGHAIDRVGARRVVLDSIDTLFAGLSDTAQVRVELHRLLRWLKQRAVTAIVACERGSTTLTRHGIEEYVYDCLLLLDHRVAGQLSTRRLRIVKYRGSSHGTNEYPFLIGTDGIMVLPVTSLGLQHDASDERVSTGIPALDAMLGGGGVHRGSTVLISGMAGVGKTSLAAHFAVAACERGERCAFVTLEESPAQVTRNMRSIGLDLARWAPGQLQFQAARPTAYGLEAHLAHLHALVVALRPGLLILDPMTTFTAVGTTVDVEVMLVRLIDFLKSEGITAVLTSLTHGATALQETAVGVSSLVDTWIELHETDGGPRGRAIRVVKSRGTAHALDRRPFRLTDQGIEIAAAPADGERR